MLEDVLLTELLTAHVTRDTWRITRALARVVIIKTRALSSVALDNRPKKDYIKKSSKMSKMLFTFQTVFRIMDIDWETRRLRSQLRRRICSFDTGSDYCSEVWIRTRRRWFWAGGYYFFSSTQLWVHFSCLLKYKSPTYFRWWKYCPRCSFHFSEKRPEQEARFYRKYSLVTESLN